MAPRIHEPPLYSWELNENHTRYDYARVVPDGQTLHVQFSVLATVNAIVAVAVMTLIVSMLRSHAVMENTFNWYLLFIAAPDFLVSFFCLITCAMSAPINQYYSEAMCGFQSFYLSWSFASNAWLNGIIVYQIHKLLKYSSIRRRYFLPTKQQVIKHAFCVYLYGTCLGLVNAFHVPFLPHKAHLWYGFACLPIEYDRASTWFFWLVFQPCFGGADDVCCLRFDRHLPQQIATPNGTTTELISLSFEASFLVFCHLVSISLDCLRWKFRSCETIHHLVGGCHLAFARFGECPVLSDEQRYSTGGKGLSCMAYQQKKQ